MSQGNDDLGLMTPAWFELPEGSEDVTRAIDALVGTLRSADAGRRNRYRLWDMLYDGDVLLDDVGAGSSDLVRGLAGDTVFNHAARALDVVHAKVTSEVPTVRASAHGADYDQYLRAQSLTRFIVGASDALELQDLVPRVAHCALRTGTGAVHVTVRSGEPSVEAVHPRELLVDPDDAIAGDPRCLYRVVPRDRRAVLRMFPDREADIASAGCATYRDYSASGRPGDWVAGGNSGRGTDCVDVVYAWSLPDDNGPGREVVCLDTGAPLVDRPMEAPRFPVAILRAWMPTVGAGFYGRGLMERLTPGQIESNDAYRHIYGQLRFSNPIAFLPDEMDVSEGSLADTDPEGVTIIRTKGSAGNIQFTLPQVIGAETLSVLDRTKSDIYQMAGTTEDVAGSQTKAGVDSAIAIRTLHDFQSQAHVDLMKRIGRLVVDVIDRVIDACRSEFSEGKGQADWEVRHPSLDVVRWSDVNMDRDQYVLELEQVSPVPDTQAGALQEVEEDAAAGRIPPEYMTRLREQPDRWWMDRCNAKEDVDFVDWLVGELLDYRRPMPELPSDEVLLPLLTDRLRREILASIRLGRPRAVVDRLREMAAQVAEASEPPPAPIQQQQPELPAQLPVTGIAGPQLPGGAGGPPPVQQ